MNWGETEDRGEEEDLGEEMDLCEEELHELAPEEPRPSLISLRVFLTLNQVCGALAYESLLV
jgi:hypothetical protein